MLFDNVYRNLTPPVWQTTVPGDFMCVVSSKDLPPQPRPYSTIPDRPPSRLTQKTTYTRREWPSCFVGFLIRVGQYMLKIINWDPFRVFLNPLFLFTKEESVVQINFINLCPVLIFIAVKLSDCKPNQVPGNSWVVLWKLLTWLIKSKGAEIYWTKMRSSTKVQIDSKHRSRFTIKWENGIDRLVTMRTYFCGHGLSLHDEWLDECFRVVNRSVFVLGDFRTSKHEVKVFCRQV